VAQVIFVSSTFDPYTQGQEVIQIHAANLFGLVRELDLRFPGIGHFIETSASIAVDGEAINAWTRALADDSEVVLFPKIAGG
jgi:molybdopterin converting factor small subunit